MPGKSGKQRSTEAVLFKKAHPYVFLPFPAGGICVVYFRKYSLNGRLRHPGGNSTQQYDIAEWLH